LLSGPAGDTGCRRGQLPARCTNCVRPLVQRLLCVRRAGRGPKGGDCLLQWTELFKGDPEDFAADDPEDRVILASVRDDQGLRIRKLIEVLVYAICFSETNEPAYYEHYLLLRALNDLRATQVDLNDFYACPSHNLDWSIARVSRALAELEAGSAVDLDRAWYRNECPSSRIATLGASRSRPWLKVS
jgi:hypothetical protein